MQVVAGDASFPGVMGATGELTPAIEGLDGGLAERTEAHPRRR